MSTPTIVPYILPYITPLLQGVYAIVHMVWDGHRPDSVLLVSGTRVY